MVYNIMIKSSEQAQRLNKIAERYPFDIWVHGVSGQADAKSLLGLMLLTIENDVKLVVEDNVDLRGLEKEIAEFRV
ncbi:MAG: HPr family phosphocarrier protein [Oscillospiraceae bacterium]|nr:HPr family phosphocarrier protein [Oscillospiraceae bacterium]